MESAPRKLKLNGGITSWILEFLVRQPRVSDHLINKFLLNDAVPVPNDEPRLKRTIILRSIESEISNGCVSEKTLDSFETLEELDRRQGIETIESMKAAYCAVAVECAVKYLGGGPGHGRAGGGKYGEAVERIWKVRLGGLEEGGGSGLVGEELSRWKEEVEAAVWDEGVGGRLLGRNTRNDAVRLVGVYLEEALKVLGPPFLEVVARRLREEKGGCGGIGSGGERVGGEGNVGPKVTATDVMVDGDQQGGVEGALDSCGQETELDGGERSPVGKETRKKILRPRLKHVAPSRHAKRGATIVDSENEDMEISPSDYDTLDNVTVNKVKEAIKSSSAELHLVVKDPLSDALHLAETLVTEMGETVMNKETSTGKPHGEGTSSPTPLVNPVTSELARKILQHDPAKENGKDAATSNPLVNQPSRPGVTDTSIPSCSQQGGAPKRSLMERNSTAQTYEWNDSIEGSQEEATAKWGKRHCLDSSRRKALTPLKKYEIAKLSRRRQKKKWTVEEEDALREGVQKFGKGNWKLIWSSRRDIFAERTEVDLKDKWRNMTRY